MEMTLLKIPVQIYYFSHSEVTNPWCRSKLNGILSYLPPILFKRITLIPPKLGYSSYRSNLVDSKKLEQRMASIADYCDINLINFVGVPVQQTKLNNNDSTQCNEFL